MRSSPEEIGLLGDKTRLRILRLLAERPLTVGQLAAVVGVSQSAVSQHLAKLRHARYVAEERLGQQVLYRLQPQELQGVIDGIAEFFSAPLGLNPLMAQQRARFERLYGPVEVALGKDAPKAPIVSRDPPTVLFVCTGNSARSQMAEGFARVFGGPAIRVLSAGLEPAGVHPMAIEVMGEAGVDISQHTSKALLPEHLSQADLVVTLCGGPNGWLPAGDHSFTWRYWPLPDPARATGARYRRLARFREVRESIMDQVLRLLGDFKIQPAQAEL